MSEWFQNETTSECKKLWCVTNSDENVVLYDCARDDDDDNDSNDDGDNGDSDDGDSDTDIDDSNDCDGDG